MPSAPPRLIVMGASAGGVHALKTVLSALNGDLPASVLVVLHSAEGFPDLLSDILQRATTLSVTTALHGERLEPGRVYIAPPDSHLLVRANHVEVVRGPRENGSRPAVNVLFRTAASAYGARVIGVVLTGTLDCGTHGALAIKAYGGTTIAQDPASAEYGEMPSRAIASGAVDEVLPLEAIAPRLTELAKQATRADEIQTPLEGPMPYSFITCPACHGSLTENGSETTLEFACHVGHRFSLRSLYAEQAEEVEAALWGAVRALEEGAVLAGRLAQAGQGALKQRFSEKERTMKQHAQAIQSILLSPGRSSPVDVGSSDWDAKAGGE
jgi:two-component system, chemotaxis family, protein-glutamate methylesterase/glutaminase